LRVFNQHSTHCGTPPSISNEPPALYVGYFENRYGEQWIFTFDRPTGEARLWGGDIGWDDVRTVRDGRVEGLILAEEEIAWLQACWKAVSFGPGG